MTSRRDVEDLFELVARAALDDGDLESGASFISTVKNFVGNHGDTIKNLVGGASFVSNFLPLL